MKKLGSLLLLLIVVIVAKVVGGAIGTSHGERMIASRAMSPDEGLKAFLDEFVVNNVKFKYPIKINESTLLTDRSVYSDSGKLSVIENFKLTAPVSVPFSEISRLAGDTAEEVRKLFCASAAEKDRIYIGHSDVGIVQKIHDMNGHLLFQIKVDKSSC